MSAAAEVVEAMIARLAADPTLGGQLGGPRVYDRLPPGTRPPYVAVDATRSTDWSTATEAGDDHRLVFTIAAEGTGRGTAGGYRGLGRGCARRRRTTRTHEPPHRARCARADRNHGAGHQRLAGDAPPSHHHRAPELTRAPRRKETTCQHNAAKTCC